jgi:hypothetical protein
MQNPRLGLALLAAVLAATLAIYVVPRGIAAGSLLSIAHDPVRISARALDGKFDAARATREIEQALADNDADLANSFVELAAERHVTLDRALTDQVARAVAETSTARHATESFARGLVTGEPKDMAGLAGTTLGDLFVFGDVRDAVREAGRLAMGQPADELILGLACVGLVITAGTYATLGASAPARVGLSVAKAARKSGRLAAGLGAAIARMLRGVVDGGRLKKAIVGASLSEPALAVHGVREAVKIERAGGLIDLARDVGRVEAKAGARAALDGLQIAQSPAEVARVAKLAEKEGGKTRAILKLLGRGAIALTVATFDLGMWILGALFSIFAFVASLKGATERITLRWLRRRRRRRQCRQQAGLAAACA